MKTFNTIDDMWVRALCDLRDYGSNAKSRDTGRSIKTRELIGWSAVLVNPGYNFLGNTRRRLCPVYASAELLWYLSGKDTLEAVIPYAPSYDKFAEPDGRAYGAYGYRIKNNVYDEVGRDLLQLALAALDKHGESRQVVISLWRPDDLTHAITAEKRDLPCTICWQLFLRDDALHLVTFMRSNDVWLGMPYDVYVFTCIQRLLADTLGVKVGTYTHHVGSLHLYEKDMIAADDALQPKHANSATHSHDWGLDILDDASSAVALESEMREGAINTYDTLRRSISQQGLEGVLGDSIACISHRWLNIPVYPTSRALLDGLHHYHIRRKKTVHADH